MSRDRNGETETAQTETAQTETAQTETARAKVLFSARNLSVLCPVKFR